MTLKPILKDGEFAPGGTMLGSDGEEFRPVSVDSEGRILTRNTVFNPDTLEYEAQAPGLTDVELRAAPVPVSAASLPLPSGAATEATLAALLGEKPKLVVCADWASSTVFYKGWAAPGSASSSAVWAVCKRVFDANGGFVETWADGNITQDNIWDNRASLTYS